MTVGAAVIVVTRDRREELDRALRSVVSQSVGCELIVVDDASTDGTSDFVRETYPTARLFTCAGRAGPAARRTFAAEKARSASRRVGGMAC